VVERVHRRLADLTYCRKNEPTGLGTARCEEFWRTSAPGKNHFSRSGSPTTA
jgi:hypothetical protein